MSFTTENDLLHAVLSDDREVAWRRFYVKYSPLVRSYANRRGIPQEDLQDILQETMLELYLALPRFRYDPDRGLFRNFILQITRFKCARYFRKRKLQHATIPFDDSNLHSNPANGFSQNTAEGNPIEFVEMALCSLLRAGRIQQSSFDAYQCYVLKQEPATTVAKRFHMTLGQVYRIKNRISALVEQFLAQSEEQDTEVIQRLNSQKATFPGLARGHGKDKLSAPTPST